MSSGGCGPTLRFDRTPIGGGARYSATYGGGPLSFSSALELMVRNPGFRRQLTRTLAASDYAAFRWETPPVTLDRLGRPFEFVLIDSPGLAAHPEPQVFQSHFDAAPAEVDVLAVPNLGGTATLVIPRPSTDPRHYAHLAAFVRGAPERQIHQLWQLVAEAVKTSVSERPLWLSTAGGGVSWLHVRIEGAPKYYGYRPYAIDG